MRRLSHRVAMVLCIAQCASLLLHNAYALWPALPAMDSRRVKESLRILGRYTRGNTAHGFFAPQVASMFILQLSQASAVDTVRWTGPDFRTRVGKTRYVAFLNWMQYLLPDSTGVHSAQRERARAIVRRIAQQELPPNAGMPTRCTVYAVKPVPLGTPNSLYRPELLIVHDEFIDYTPTSHD